jgi:hypothetical protein
MEPDSEDGMESDSEGSQQAHGADREGSQQAHGADRAIFVAHTHDGDFGERLEDYGPVSPASELRDEFDHQRFLIYLRVGPLWIRVRGVLKESLRAYRGFRSVRITPMGRGIPSGVNLSRLQVYGPRVLADYAAFPGARRWSATPWQEAGQTIVALVMLNNIQQVGNLTISISHIRYLCQPYPCQPPNAAPPPNENDEHSVKVFLYWGRKLVRSYDVLEFQEAALIGRLMDTSDAGVPPLLAFVLAVVDVAGHAAARLVPYDTRYFPHMQEDLAECWALWSSHSANGAGGFIG